MEVGPSEERPLQQPGPSVFVISDELVPSASAGLPLELPFKTLSCDAPKTRCWAAHDIAGDSRLVLVGGYSGSSYFNDVFLFDGSLLAWRPVVCSGPSPPPLYAHTVTSVPSSAPGGVSLVVCCGGTGRNYSSAVHVLDLDFSGGGARGTWRGGAFELPSSKKRGAHASAVVDGYVYMMGGDSGQGVYFREMFRIDPRGGTCEKLRVKGNKPAKRGWHSMIAYKQNLFVFGGTDGTVTFNDLHVFDTVTRSWSCPATTGELPEARYSHSAVLVGSEMFIFGGNHRGKALNSACIFNMDRMCWLHPRLSGDVPSPRYGHSMALIRDKIFLFGGYAAGSHPSNQMFYLSLASSRVKNEIQTLGPVILHDLVHDLRKLVVQPDFSDVTFLVENRPIPAHRAILCARSDYFRRMFASGMRESASGAVIAIADMKYDVFRSVLEFLYSGCPTLTEVNAVDMLIAADLFRLDSLKLLASRVLIRMVSISNIHKMYTLADQYSAIKLKSNLIKYARRNVALLQSMPDQLAQMVVISAENSESESDDEERE